MTPWQDRLFIIAEAGVNHNGDLALAHQLIDAAADAGADAVKFQTFKAEALVSQQAAMADYQKKNTGKEESQLDMLRRLELSQAAHIELMIHARKRNILFFSTAFDMESVEFLIDLNIPLWKIPSGEITNYPYLHRIGSLDRPTILSTGMADLSEVEDAVNVLLEAGLERGNLCILHCNTEYPTPFEDVNLRAMQTLGQAFDCIYGYSDHTLGCEVAIAATALGAAVLEKHFTLNKHMPGPDHAASLEVNELRTFVQTTRNTRRALGSSIKRPSASEICNKSVARKSLVATRPIKRGETFSPENITAKRPGTGISPMRWLEVIGRIAVRDFDEDDLISF